MSVGERPMVIAVPMKGFAQWGGGIGFIRLMLEGLLHDPAARVVALIPRPTWRQILRYQAGTWWRFFKALARGEFRWSPARPASPAAVQAGIEDFLPRLAVRFYSDNSRGLAAALRESGAGVAIPCFAPMGAGCPVPWVGYLYDFQHHHLPEFFSDKERLTRDAAFTRMLEAAPAVICNSDEVRNDAERFRPGSAAKLVVLPFTPVPRPEWFELDPRAIARQYGLPERYFIVCNQFWIHKDHPTAIKAFAAFLSRGGDPGMALVCTGSQDDFRAVTYFDSIQQLITSLGLEGRVHLLGHIPKLDQAALLRGAVALLQPTLFEGGRGGGAVYDAVALGVPSLVSDIAVNRELAEGSCRFFTQRDPASLAALMLEVAASSLLRPTRDELVARAHGLVGDLSLALHAAIAKAVDHRGA